MSAPVSVDMQAAVFRGKDEVPMFPPRKILFPVDFSERCGSAARMVETFAGHFQTELTLLHVLEPLTYNDIPVDAAGIAEQRLAEFMAEEFKYFDVRRVMLEGDAATRIAEYAYVNGIDLIMLPTHGYGAFRRLILGSVTSKVLRSALCPVWTGVHMEHVPRLEDIGFKRILCAVDLGQQSCPTAKWAKSFASEFGAELELVHAVPEANRTPVVAHENPNEDLVARAGQQMRAVKDCVGTDAKAFVLGDEVASAVCGCAAREKADLLVIGRSMEGGVLGRLRENAYSIIRQSPCPVVSV
ncbi:MAG TPA: universal stress protein [Bryobacteraceae bacterium]|nr:universal stress protein [Bryobacteraceae bacterium]